LCLSFTGVRLINVNNVVISLLRTQSALFAAGNVTLKAEGKRPLGRPRRRWEDNIKMELQEV
jgi:hypothetical protein